MGAAGSLVLLALSGDQFVIALARISGSLRIRPTVAAALVGGVGTSIAELIVAGVAAARSPSLAVGSLVGSIVANVCLGLAIAALVVPLKVDSRTVRREAPLSVAAVVLFALMCATRLTSAKSIVMIVALVVVVAYLAVSAWRGAARDKEDALGTELTQFAATPVPRSTVETVRAVAMLGIMLAGAELMVTSSIGLAKHLGISQGFAGITLVGIGTSAPLIAASIQAARRSEQALVVGNVIGGNLFIALGGGAIVGFVASGRAASAGDLALVLMAGVVLASWLAMARGSTLVRVEALALLVAYGVTLPFINH